MKTVLSDIWNDLRSPRVVPAVCIGAVLGMLVVIIEVSFAAMIFSGDMAHLATRGAGLMLFGGFVLCAGIAFTSGFKSAISLPQDAPTAVLSTVGAAVGTQLALFGNRDMFMTMAALIGLASLITALCYILVGRFRLANMLRFMPYPVVAGFLAGSGWLLTVGSVGVMCDVGLSFATLGRLMQPAMLLKWGPGALFGLALFAALKIRPHFLVLPVALVIGAAAYHIVFYAIDLPLAQAKASGLLLTGVPSTGLFPAFSLSDLSAVHWDVVANHAPALFTVALVCIVGMLLNMSGIELGGGMELDMNREFRTSGLMGVISGLGGSGPGYPAISLSMLGHKTNAYSRLTGLTAAALIGGVLFAGGGLLEYFPKPLLGGLLLLLGLSFIDDWAVASRKRLPAADYGIVLVIFATVGLVGFLEGVAVGLGLAVVFFVVRFSSIPAIRSQFTAAERRSLAQRSSPHQAILSMQGDTLTAYRLHGYLFFGSASSLCETLRADLAGTPKPRCMVLDFTEVTGMDVSAVNNLQRLFQAAHEANVTVALTGVSESLLRTMQAIIDPGQSSKLHFAPDMDQGLELCEDILIESYESSMNEDDGARDALFDTAVEDVMARLDRQAFFEDLAERLSPWLREEHWRAGEHLLTRHEPAPGARLLLRGTATQTGGDDGARLRGLDAGSAITPRGAWEAAPAASTFTADSDATTALLTPEARVRLERENPALALELYGYLLGGDADTFSN